MPARTLFELVSGWSPDQLATVIQQRGLDRTHRPITTMQELTSALDNPTRMDGSLDVLPLPAVQLLATVLVYGNELPRTLLTELLRDAPSSVVDDYLAMLTSVALAWVDHSGNVRVPHRLVLAMPDALGLGSALDRLFGPMTADEVRPIAKALGLPSAGDKSRLMPHIRAFYRDGSRVRQAIAAAPDTVAPDLHAWLHGHAQPQASYPPEWRDRAMQSFRWARERGLVFGPIYRDDPEVPAAVRVAFLSVDDRIPFTARRPDVRTDPATVADIDAEAMTAALTFVGTSAAILDAVAQQPLSLLKTYGIGTREVNRLARTTNKTEAEIRLHLEVAAQAKLLVHTAGKVEVSADYPSWRAKTPAQQLISHLTAWFQLPSTPTVYLGPDGKALPALERRYGNTASRMRVQILELLAKNPGVIATADFMDLLYWQHPFSFADQTVVAQAIWDEASLLGVIAAGSLSSLGKALLARDGVALGVAAAAILPSATRTAIFGSDLTVLVAGVPAAEITALLDECGVRESSGSASIWRLSQNSVRRAFDNGYTAATLTDALSRCASTPLPQPLLYLINDVDRLFGQVTVGTMTSYFTTQDSTLMSEITAHRKLSTLGIRVLSSTVAATRLSQTELLKALREAGYLPTTAGRVLKSDAAGPGATVPAATPTGPTPIQPVTEALGAPTGDVADRAAGALAVARLVLGRQ